MTNNVTNKKRILIAPLDWGLGHATRCIPIIRSILQAGHEVIIAAQGNPAHLLHSEFENITILPISNYNMSYASNAMLLWIKFPFMIAKVFRCAAREHQELDAIVKRHNIDIVISDQRFGFHNKKVFSIYITHQLCVIMPQAFAWIERIIARHLRSAAEAFDEVWIPDYPGPENLTGSMTRKYPYPNCHRFIGPLSRFQCVKGTFKNEEKIDLLVMISGPEPQRTQFEQIIVQQLRSFTGRAIILLGKPSCAKKFMLNPTVECITHASSCETARFIQIAEAIICRGGYTTIMELVSIGKKAVLVPTPGQTEQEYLCTDLSKKGWFISRKQQSFNVEESIDALKVLPSKSLPHRSINLLQTVIEELLNK